MSSIILILFTLQLNHPVAGTLDFEISSFDVSDNSCLKLIVHATLSETDTTTKMKSLLDE